MNDNIIVWGLGHIGLITTSFLCERGNVVYGVDHNSERVREILELKFSPNVLANKISIAIQSKRLLIETTPPTIVNKYHKTVHFICVETPTLIDGQQDLKQVLSVLKAITKIGLIRNDLIVIRSTVLPSTTEKIILPFLEKYKTLGTNENYDVIINPSFSKHNEYEEDLLKSKRIVFEIKSLNSLEYLTKLYNIEISKFITMSYTEVELTKYIDNCFHALKITFANEVGLLSETLGCNSKEIMNTICLDKRLNISEKYLEPGLPFGGKCLPKDIRAINHFIANGGLILPILSSIDISNENYNEYKRSSNIGIASSKSAYSHLTNRSS